jgi:hypothetical protein
MKVSFFERHYYAFLKWWAKLLPGPTGTKTYRFIETLVEFREATNQALDRKYPDAQSYSAVLNYVDKGTLAVRDFNGELVRYYTRQLKAVLEQYPLPNKENKRA